ncbi:MAG: hypothetical protein QOD72_1945, partial [Acidimicrobiaceae bacterium]|nr:hypothetical protein [Acidimicrobiaceae bacterium]
MPIGRAEAATGRREQRRRRSVSLRMSMVGLAGLVVVATGANALYQRQVALGDARSTGTAAAWSAAIRTSNRELAVTLVALILFVAAVWVLQRRIVGSLTRLGAGVRAATLNRASGSFVLAAPAEVSALVDDFNELLRTTGRELEAASRLSTIVESSADAIFTQTPAGV